MCKHLLVIFLLFVNIQLFAQFYNGTQTSFGKNRVQYTEAYWRYLRYSDFDIYFDKEGRALADYIAKNFTVIQQETKEILNLEYPQRIIIVVCNTIQDFHQTNIGLSTANQDYNIGGVTQIIDNKIIVYFNGNHNDLLNQVKNGLATLLINEFIYGSENYREILSNSSNIEFPTWFTEGLINYVSTPWNPILEEHVRYILQNYSFKKIMQLQDYNAIALGHAFWKYIAEHYGQEVIANILFISGLTGDINASFSYSLGADISQLLAEMNYYYNQKLTYSTNNEFVGTKLNIKKKHSKTTIIQYAISPDGKYLAYVTERDGLKKMFVYDIAKSKTKKIWKHGVAIKQITDNSMPVLAWNTNNKVCSFFYEYKGKIMFANYIPETKELLEREFLYFEKILSFDYAKNGFELVFSGVNNGQTDIYIYDTRSYDTKQITDDSFDEFYPKYSNNDTKITYASNATVNMFKDSVSESFNLYTKSLQSKKLEPELLFATDYDSEIMPTVLNDNSFLYISNQTGIQNLYKTHKDSTAIAIDTSVHYTFTNTSWPLTQYNNNVIQYQLANNKSQICYLVKNKNRYNFYVSSIPSPIQTQNTQSFYKQKQDSILTKNKAKSDSIYSTNINPSLQNQAIDYTNYMFEYELHPYNLYVDSLLQTDSITSRYKSSHNYESNFYVNQVVNQVDFGFINSSYQKFTGNEFNYIPKLNVFMKLGVIDLFEDYRLTGGVRLFGDFNSNEYLFSLENLKKRVDKQYVFHRQSYISYSNNYYTELIKNFDHHFYALYTYPLSVAAAFKFVPSVRYIKNVSLSINNINSLREPSTSEYWFSNKIEYVYDNTIPIDLNILRGSRAKVFGEFFYSLYPENEYLYVFGIDARNYVKVYKNIIFASRFAYSYAGGTSPLLYYLGSLDNWINPFFNNPKFEYDIEYDRTKDWAYQAIATNVRGFKQNIRNGPSFSLLNLEMRVPIVKVFIKKPIDSDFIANLQIVGFADAGAAWTGFIPGSKENAYNFSTKGDINGPVYVKIDEMRPPYVYGYGYGFRTRLFGYFFRLDFARGVDQGITQKKVYFSLSLDF